LPVIYTIHLGNRRKVVIPIVWFQVFASFAAFTFVFTSFIYLCLYILRVLDRRTLVSCRTEKKTTEQAQNMGVMVYHGVNDVNDVTWELEPRSP
jgi:hypothetical protein